jgi:hypothetical protein
MWPSPGPGREIGPPQPENAVGELDPDPAVFDPSPDSRMDLGPRASPYLQGRE